MSKYIIQIQQFTLKSPLTIKLYIFHAMCIRKRPLENRKDTGSPKLSIQQPLRINYLLYHVNVKNMTFLMTTIIMSLCLDK